MAQSKKKITPEPRILPPVVATAWWSRPGFISLLLALVTLAVYWRVIDYDFINYDDPAYVSENPQVLAGITWDGLVWACHTTLAGNWHPLTWFSFMLEAQFFGANPGAYHLTNVLLHVVNTLLLFALLRRLTGTLWRSAFVAALFALHPLHVESVAWIAERKDMLSTLFWMLTLLFYMRYAQSPIGNRQSAIVNYSLALFFFVCGLMSKPMLVTLPFVLLLLDHWPLKRIADFRFWTAPWRRLLMEKFPFFTLSALFCVIALWAQKAATAVVTLSDLPFSDRVGNMFVSYARYLGKTVWPVALANPYPHPTSWPVTTVAGAALLVAVFSLAALGLARRRPYVFTGWFWFLGTMIPVIGLVQVGLQSMADRYTYVPLIGVFIILAWGAGELVEHWRPSRARNFVVGATAGLLLLVCTGRTVNQLNYWRDGESLFRHAIAVTQKNSVANGCLGMALTDQGRFVEASDYLVKAVQINPEDTNCISQADAALTRLDRLDALARRRHGPLLLPDSQLAAARENLGEALAGQRRYDDAIPQYTDAVRLAPDYAEAHDHLGFALAQKGQLVPAIEHYHAAIQAKPDYAAPHNNLGCALFLQGNYAEAAAQFQQALHLKPDYAEAADNLGSLLAKQGRLNEAVDSYNEALRLDPNLAKAHFDLGCVFAVTGRGDEAVAQLAEAIRLQPGYSAAHDNLGCLLVNQGRLAEAAGHFRQALQSDSNDAKTHFDFGCALVKLGRHDEAAAQFTAALRLAPDYPGAEEQLGQLGR